MRKALLVCVVALLAAGALIVIAGLGRLAALGIGGALVLVGVPLMALARVQIGSAFAVAPKAKALVTQGLYAKIPHPLYVFLDVALLGVVIALRQPWWRSAPSSTSRRTQGRDMTPLVAAARQTHQSPAARGPCPG